MLWLLIDIMVVLPPVTSSAASGATSRSSVPRSRSTSSLSFGSCSDMVLLPASGVGIWRPYSHPSPASRSRIGPRDGTACRSQTRSAGAADRRPLVVDGGPALDRIEDVGPELGQPREAALPGRVVVLGIEGDE